jgi:hypothetical protein
MNEETKHPNTPNVVTEQDKGRCAPATGSAACPDYWMRYEMKDGEEVLNMSKNLMNIAGREVFKALESIKAKMTPQNGASPNAEVRDPAT